MDDIVIFSDNKEFLEQLVPRIKSYLQQELELEIKNDYVIDASINGIELLGYIHFPSYRLLSKVNIIRAKTLFQSIQAHQACTYHQWCSAISRIGWISWANSYNFMCQYFATISPILTLYYYTTHYACKHFDTNQIFLTNYKTHHQRRLKI